MLQEAIDAAGFIGLAGGSGQDESKITPLVFDAFGPYAPTVHFNHDFGDRQAQSHPAVFTGQVRFYLVKTFENMRQVF